MMPRLRRITALALVLSAAALLASRSAIAQSDPGLHLALGNPSGAAASVYYPSNYLIQRPQYALSYWRDGGIPNWVSWHLSAQDHGSAPRTTSFYTDTSLPTGWYRVSTTNYTNTGFDRGHNCPSADRTLTAEDNKATFLMTNVFPQTPDNNQGPWADLEDYCRDLAVQGYELYIICGGDDSRGWIASGRVNVPAYTWKVIVALPEGTDDLARISTETRVIAVEMPNVQGIRSDDWRWYRTTVDQIEYDTGYDLLSNVAPEIQAVLEAGIDAQ
jgi:endonuclease G, mitochondrial